MFHAAAARRLKKGARNSMKKKRNTFRRIQSIILVVAMLLSMCLTGVTAFAEPGPYNDGDCTCDTQCAEGAVNDACPVCEQNVADCQGDVPAPLNAEETLTLTWAPGSPMQISEERPPLPSPAHWTALWPNPPP